MCRSLQSYSPAMRTGWAHPWLLHIELQEHLQACLHGARCFISSGQTLGMGLPSYMWTHVEHCKEQANHVPKRMYRFVFPPAMCEFQVLHILVNIYYCQSFKLEHFSVCVVYLIMVLICISLVTNNTEHLFMCWLAICVCSFVKYLFYPF